MADTRMQLEVEDWVRRNWMPTQYGRKFSRERLPLRSGGVFDFDAVSDDHSIVATISTSGAKTSTGNQGSGKILKLRSDMLFLTMVEAKRRVIILTERDMCDQCEKEFGWWPRSSRDRIRLRCDPGRTPRALSGSAIEGFGRRLR